MKAITRTHRTVDAIVRQRISFWLGQEVVDRTCGSGDDVWGIVVALTDEGCFLRYRNDAGYISRWFVPYAKARPRGDGRRYV